MGLIHSILAITVLLMTSSFIIMTVAVFAASSRRLSAERSLERVHLILLRLLGTILLILVKGTILIPLEMLLSPLLCFTASGDYPGCRSSVLSNWYAAVVGIILSMCLIFMTCLSATFSTRECFIKKNYLSSATPSCELLDQLVKVMALLCAMFSQNMGRPIAGGVAHRSLDPPLTGDLQSDLVQLQLNILELPGRVTEHDMGRLRLYRDDRMLLSELDRDPGDLGESGLLHRAPPLAWSRHKPQNT